MKYGLLILLIVIVVLLLILFAVGYMMVRLSFRRNDNGAFERDGNPPESTEDPDYLEYYERSVEGQRLFYAQDPEDVSIKSFDGLTLKGWYLPAKEPSDVYMICVHGYRAYGPYEYGARMKFLLSLGCNLLIPDNRAHGRSEGTYIGFGNLDSIDILGWCSYLTDRFGKDIKILLQGCSMGAATVLAAAGDPKAPENIKGVLADCGFSSGIDEIRAQVADQFHLPYFPFVPVAVLVNKLVAKYDLRERGAKDMIGNFKGKLLIVHGGDDTFVPTVMSGVIYEAAKCDKELLIVPGAKHVLSYLKDPSAYEGAFLNWYAKSLPADKENETGAEKEGV